MTSQQIDIAEKLMFVERFCRERGMPLTVQRRTIIDNLAGRQDHPTADDVFDDVKGRLASVSRATVYRVLETFVRLGVVKKICSPEAKARFDADIGRHHHIQCVNCGNVTDYHELSLDQLPLPGRDVTGFDIIDYSINFSGVCRSCRSKGQHPDDDAGCHEKSVTISY